MAEVHCVCKSPIDKLYKVSVGYKAKGVVFSPLIVNRSILAVT